MKKIILYTLILFLTVSNWGCKEFLEEEPFSFIAESNFYQNEADAQAALTAAYTGFGRASNTLYARDILTLAEVPGFTAQELSVESTLDNFEWVPSMGTIGSVWSSSYTAILLTNTVIEKVPLIVDITPSIQDRIVAEARVLRAIHYFNLVRFFANVPIVTASEPETLEPSNMSTAADVWQLIISDLQAAENVLPASYGGNDLGRVTSGAAKALLAKVYLQRSGLAKYSPVPELFGVSGVDEYDLALAKCNEVINSGVYELFADYVDNFLHENENGKEIVLSVQYESGAQENGLFEYTGIASAKGAAGGFGSINSPMAFTNTFTEADSMRLKGTYITSYIDNNDVPHVFPGDGERGHTRKYKGDVMTAGDFTSDFNIIRYADILLMQSEAANESGSGDALLGINMVRARAGLAPLVDMDQTALREALINERAWELSFEAHNYFDLQRTGKLAEKNPGKLVENKHYVYPIPLNELDLNPNLVQNPGY
ncbi:MAG: RagB/SusD family nutrient uptake outer membrane protein [Saprospiraceae bacterium]|nr:RagB/SusD family nutrient uptake outer membrane protein [Lewinella sp.]